MILKLPLAIAVSFALTASVSAMGIESSSVANGV